MKITALIKTFRGDEFIEAMIRSIYNYVDNIVFVNSELAWEHGLLDQTSKSKHGNTCKAEIQRVKELMDDKGKIIALDYDTTNQFKQCTYGFEYIKKNLDCDFVMLIDTDEVWDDYNLSQAVKFLQKHNDHGYIYRSRLFTYIKKINYRVEPVEVMCPTIFVSSKRRNLGVNHRACHLLPMYKMTTEKGTPIFFHHLVYVRRNLESVLEKIKSSNGYEKNLICNLNVWTREVWENIPNTLTGEWKDGFHPAIQFRKHWVSIKQIENKDFPDVFREYPHLVKDFI